MKKNYMSTLYVSELNEVDFNKIKLACIVALNELGQIEELDNALDSRLCDLIDLIDIDLIQISE